ncbi:MAG TPA: AAA family ATPase, partial [Ilumatobacteraceae bacterium]
MDSPTGTAHRLVGRTAELRRLESVVQAGEGLRLALVGGEAGIGKTRLVDESLSMALTSSLVLRLRGDADRRSRPFDALLGALWPIVGEWTVLPAPLATRSDALRELLGPVAPGLDPGPRSLGTDVLERAAIDLLRHLTPDPAPLVVVADDLHWIDPESVGVLQQLVVGVAGLDDAVLLGTYRPDGLLARSPLSALVTTVERRPDGVNLRLDRLSLDEVADFAAQVLGNDVPYRAVKALHHRSGGNPFFLEELLAVAAEAGIDDIADLPLPWTVTELLRDSVMALTPEERTVVESAAVLGQRVPFDLLAKVTRLDEDELIARLRGVVGAGLLVEEDVDVFAFRHAIVREAIAESLLGRERRRVHELALAVLSDDSNPDPALIAHHAYGAGKVDEMVAAVRRASVEALACGAPHRALEFAEMGLAEAPDDLVLDEVATRSAWLIGALDDALEHGTRWANAAVDPADESKARRVLMRIEWEARDTLGQRREIDRLRA